MTKQEDQELVLQLDLMKDALLEYETIDADQIADIMEGRKPRPPADWNSSDSGSGSTRASARSADTKAADSTIGGPASEH